MTTPKTTHPALYRVGQFFVALRAYLPIWAGGVRGKGFSYDETLVKSILSTPAQQCLFDRMPPNDQRHAVAVVHTLQQAEYNHPALMQAALLHDVGKSLGQPIIHRVLIVLFKAFWPVALTRLETTAMDVTAVSWWRRPFVVHARHPAIGAIWAADANCDPLAVSLIAKHQDEPVDESTEKSKLLAALQWADDLN